MRKATALVTVLSFLLSGCVTTGNDPNGGGMNFGELLGIGLGIAAAGGGAYYMNKQAKKNRDDGADYCAQRYSGKMLRTCILNLPGR
jgi:hypothetical protein